MLKSHNVENHSVKIDLDSREKNVFLAVTNVNRNQHWKHW